jgi:alkylhydroperoxidase/carboxymuconolactone decarboxylase family protein YurZ
MVGDARPPSTVDAEDKRPPAPQGANVERRREELLRRMALNDEAAMSAALDTEVGGGDRRTASVLDAKTDALIRLAALVASGAAPASYQWVAATAISAGATEEEVVDVLATLAPVVGLARVDLAAPELAVALGVDIDTVDRASDVERPRRQLPATGRPAERDVALLRLAALVALGAQEESFREAGSQARAAGATDDDVIGVLLAVAPTVGLARVVAATPGLALAVGYDIDAALEDSGDLPR